MKPLYKSDLEKSSSLCTGIQKRNIYFLLHNIFFNDLYQFKTEIILVIKILQNNQISWCPLEISNRSLDSLFIMTLCALQLPPQFDCGLPQTAWTKEIARIISVLLCSITCTLSRWVDDIMIPNSNIELMQKTKMGGGLHKDEGELNFTKFNTHFLSFGKSDIFYELPLSRVVIETRY